MKSQTEQFLRNYAGSKIVAKRMSKEEIEESSKKILEYLKTGKWYKEQEVLAKDFKLSVEDLHNLYDLFHIVDSPKEIQIDFRKTLELNKMDNWFRNLFDRLEEVCLNELGVRNDKLE